MKQRAGCDQVALVEHALRQRVGVHTGIDPAKQTGRLCRKGAAVRQRELGTAGARPVEPGAYAFGMATQLALVNTPGQRFFQQGGRGQGGEEFGIQQAFNQVGRRRQKTDAPAWCENFRETADVNRALQPIERTQPRGVFRRQVAVGVVFNNVKVVRIS